MDAPAQYCKELRGDLELYPMWMPDERVEAGFYGRFHRGVFRKEGTLKGLGLDVASKRHSGKTSFKKHRGIVFAAASTTQAKANPIDASLGVSIRATRENGWAFSAIGSRVVEIEDREGLRAAILELVRDGVWKKDWLLVTDVREVDKLTVIVSRTASADASATARAMLADAADILLQEDASISSASGDLLVLQARDTTPLFRLSKMRGFLDPELKPISAGGTHDQLSFIDTPDEEMFAE